MNVYTMKRENSKLNWAVTSEILKIFSQKEERKPMGESMLHSKKLK